MEESNKKKGFNKIRREEDPKLANECSFLTSPKVQ
jgi:hypothetical protein